MNQDKYSPKWLLNEIKNAKNDAHALLKIVEFQNEIGKQLSIGAVGQSLRELNDGDEMKVSFKCEKNKIVVTII